MRFRVARLRALTFARFSADPICSARKKNRTCTYGIIRRPVFCGGCQRRGQRNRFKIFGWYGMLLCKIRRRSLLFNRVACVCYIRCSNSKIHDDCIILLLIERRYNTVFQTNVRDIGAARTDGLTQGVCACGWIMLLPAVDKVSAFP